MLQGYYCDDSEIMFSNDDNDPKYNEWVRYEDAAERIKELEDEDKRLKLELAKLIDLLRLPSLFSMLSQLEKDSIEHSEQALKGGQ